MASHKLDLTPNRNRRTASTQPPEDEAAKSQTGSAPEESPDDEDILSGIPERGKGNNTLLFIVLGVALVVVVAFVFLLFVGRGGKESTPTNNPDPTQSVQQGETPGQSSQATATPASESDNLSGMGTQDFTQNTNMTTSDVLTNPDQYVEDLYGLTTRVDYTVSSISNIADFVSYEKHRGTWGGGLELYWLDADYKGKHYVVQVPFQYYKELDDTGIVPVKMEVLTIDGSTPDEKLTVISYMCLDEETLKDILKTQSKSK